MTMIATLATILANTPAARADDPKTQIAPNWRWVDVVTENGQTGESCGIEPGGRVDEIGRLGDRVLVRYSPPPGRKPWGTACKGGKLFFLPIVEFEQMTARYRERAAVLQEEVRVIRSLLKK